MAEKKSKLARMVSFEDLMLTILLSWLGKKALDYLWEQGKARIRFEGQNHLAYYFYSLLGGGYLNIVFMILLLAPEYDRAIDLRTILRVHKRYHELVRNEKCSPCKTLNLIKHRLKLYVPDPELYPPF